MQPDSNKKVSGKAGPIQLEIFVVVIEAFRRFK